MNVNIAASLISLAVGVVIPGLVSLLSRINASNGLRALLSAMLSAVGGALSGALTATPTHWSQWESILWQIALAWIAAAVSYLTGWKPTGASHRIARATARFGIGPRQKPADPPAPGEAGSAPLGTAILLAVISAYLWAVVALAVVGMWAASVGMVMAGTGVLLVAYLYERVSGAGRSDMAYSRQRREPFSRR